jgi:hypothetical protein
MARQDRLLAVAPGQERFSSKAGAWRIPFSLVSPSPKSPGAVLRSVRLNGRQLDTSQIRFLHGDARQLPVVFAGRYIPPQDLLEWHRLFVLEEGMKHTTLAENTHFTALGTQIHLAAGRLPETEDSNEIIIPWSQWRPWENRVLHLEVLFGSSLRGTACGFETSVSRVPALLPGRKRHWVAGNLQVHSTSSDGRRSLGQIRSLLEDRGYDFAYLADGHHTKKLLDEGWQDYRKETAAASSKGFSMFPGVETAVGPVETEEGHLLVYGTNETIAGLAEHTLGPQGMIDQAVANEPAGPSSASISHPMGLYRWMDFTVLGHSGMEVMSGAIQTRFDLVSAPSRLWRQEIMRHAGGALDGGAFPSPHSGTDWHGYWFEPLRGYTTWVRVEPDWESLDYPGRKRAVDRGLYEGRVVTSARGSLGFFKVAGEHVGGLLRGLAAGETLPLEVEYFSSARGTAHIYIFRNDLEETVFYRAFPCDVGEVKRWSDSLVFPGGHQVYWMYAGGPDYVYSSPIFASED